MPSDPLPLSPELDVAWESLKRRLIIDCPDEYPQACLAVMEHRPGIEQEARTLERTQVIAELRGWVEDNYPDDGGRGSVVQNQSRVHRGALLRALSRLGERE